MKSQKGSGQLIGKRAKKLWISSSVIFSAAAGFLAIQWGAPVTVS